MRTKHTAVGGFPAAFSRTIFEEVGRMDQIARLNQKLAKIRGTDPISKARKAALLREICRLQAEM